MSSSSSDDHSPSPVFFLIISCWCKHIPGVAGHGPLFLTALQARNSLNLYGNWHFLDLTPRGSCCGLKSSDLAVHITSLFDCTLQDALYPGKEHGLECVPSAASSEGAFSQRGLHQMFSNHSPLGFYESRLGSVSIPLIHSS